MMSEKRFKLSSETVLQYQIMNNDTDLNESEVVDLLNKLYEENERLKSRNSYNVEDMQMEIGELKEENEQLMEQIQILKKEVRDFLHLCDVCDIQSHLSDECEEVLNDE